MSRSIYKNNPYHIDNLCHTDDLSIGNRIKQKRRNKGVTEAKMAEDLSTYIGKISRLETGKTEIKAGDLLLISRYLGCSIDYLVTGEETPTYVKANVSEHQSMLADLMHRISKLDESRLQQLSEAIRLLYQV